ncbi:kinase [Saccharopolyspora sp. HNM0983]|uniref:Kinase n=1 Tax=Saccharopolyspora montiporae TaxID=2781240 RepID=A0A929G204_9PSEU|nr:PfkB family carbohydrate kinase [Saccharopolyspora sp. HNM0983]MBE9375233.1 kinase [Saccharopolyspora sp. HNM0983]
MTTDSPTAAGVFAGLTTLDVVQHVDRFPGRDEKVTAAAQFLSAGGPAANAAVTFSALGGSAVLVTALGSGPAADVARADLRAHGVRVVEVPVDGGDAPVSAVLVDRGTGERSVAGTDATALAPAAPIGIGSFGADVVLLDGHYPEVAAAVLDAERAPVVLDAGRWKEPMRPLLTRAQTVIASAGFRTPGAADAVATSRALRGMGVPTVVTTHGPDPVHWIDGAESGSVAPPRVAAVDTLGAGDAFHGAYCWQLVAGRPDVPGRIAAAARVAALRTTIAGPRAWLRELHR